MFPKLVAEKFSKFFGKLDFCKFSKNLEIMIFQKLWKSFENQKIMISKIFENFQKSQIFWKNPKIFRGPTLGTHNFFSNQRILDFFLRSTWNLISDSMKQPRSDDFTKEKSYFTFWNILTANSRFYTKYYPVSWNNTIIGGELVILEGFVCS